MSSNKFVVYTCITGNYDTLREIRYVSPDIDYICFTDNAALTSKTWKIRQIPNDLKNIDQIKKQRLLKILPHKYLPEYSVSLWLDSNIEIISDVKDFFKKYDLSRTFLYTNKHPTRDCIYREQLAVIRLKKDTYENTNPQINRYRDEGYPEHYGLAETNIMLRAHNNLKCVKLMNLWGEEILNGSHRDQLSFNYAIWKTDCKDFIQYLDEKYYNLHLGDSAFFKLKKHLRIDKFIPFAPVSIDTKKIEKENEVKVQEKKQEELIKKEYIPNIQVDSQKKQEENKKKEPEKKVAVEKPLSVVVFTHNRTNVAVETIKSLIKNLKYSNIKWIISDDRSNPGHIEELLKTFAAYKIKPKVCKTTKYRFGLGASMNNGLREGFKYSDVVLRVEDDWILEKELDIGKHIKTISTNNKVAGIRLGMVGGGVDTDPKYYSGKNYKVIFGTDVKSWLLVNQVFLIHKRLHDKLGWYLENANADKTEEDFRERYNRFSDNGKKNMFVLFPSEIKWRTYDDPSLYFIHVGRSTLGHSIYKEPKRYRWLYEEKNEIVDKKMETGTIDVVYVIGKGSCHSNDELRYSLRSIEKYFKDLRNVFIVGSKPDFIADDKVIFIPTEDICGGDLANKDRNHWHNMEVVCKDPRLSENFLFSADDFLITKPSTWKDFAPRHTGVPSRQYMESGSYNLWRKTRIETLKRFPANKRYLWHPHMMSQMNKTKTLQCCKDSDYMNRNDVVIFTYYYNHEPMPKPLRDFDTDEVHSARLMDLTKRHISHWDEAFSYPPFRKQLDDLFPKMSRFEKYDMNKNLDTINCSVIVPCYNSEKYVRECLDSILNQKTNFDYEIICVNDGSTDNTGSILEEYKQKHDCIHIITQNNQGLSMSRNNALKIARGQYIVFLDSDDMLADNAIDVIIKDMTKHQMDVLYFDSSVFFDNAAIKEKFKRKYPDNGYFRPSPQKIVSGVELFNFLYSKNRIVFPACLQAVKKEFLVDNKIAFMPNVLYEDNIFSMKVLLSAYRSGIEERKLYKRRIREDSIVTSFKSYNHVRSYILVCREIYKFINYKLSKNKTTKDRVFNSVVKGLMRQAKIAYAANKKNPEFLKDKNKYNDAATIDKYMKVLEKQNITMDDFKRSLA